MSKIITDGLKNLPENENQILKNEKPTNETYVDKQVLLDTITNARLASDLFPQIATELDNVITIAEQTLEVVNKGIVKVDDFDKAMEEINAKIANIKVDGVDLSEYLKKDEIQAIVNVINEKINDLTPSSTASVIDLTDKTYLQGDLFNKMEEGKTYKIETFDENKDGSTGHIYNLTVSLKDNDKILALGIGYGLDKTTDKEKDNVYFRLFKIKKGSKDFITTRLLSNETPMEFPQLIIPSFAKTNLIFSARGEDLEVDEFDKEIFTNNPFSLTKNSGKKYTLNWNVNDGEFKNGKYEFLFRIKSKNENPADNSINFFMKNKSPNGSFVYKFDGNDAKWRSGSWTGRKNQTTGWFGRARGKDIICKLPFILKDNEIVSLEPFSFTNTDINGIGDTYEFKYTKLISSEKLINDNITIELEADKDFDLDEETFIELSKI